MKKKGESIIMMMFEIIAVLLVSYLMISVARAYGESDLVFRVSAAEEIRMMVDTEAGVPGDVLIRYPHNVSSYNIILNQGSISIFKKGEPENKWVTRTFILPKYHIAEGVMSEETPVCLEKKGRKIILRKCSDSDNLSP